MIPIPVVRQTARIETENLRYYECRFCGFEDKVLVGAIGMGRSTAYGSESEALNAARYSAQVDENDMLKLCPCPKCGRRDSAGFIAKWVIAVLATGAFATLLPLGSQFLFGRTDLAGLMLAFGSVLALAVVGIVFWLFLAKWINSTRSVVFGANGSLAAREDVT